MCAGNHKRILKNSGQNGPKVLRDSVPLGPDAKGGKKLVDFDAVSLYPSA